jgi:integrase
VDPSLGRTTLGAWWDRWWATTVALRPSSRARDESYWRTHIEPNFGEVPLARIDHTSIRAWVADLVAAGKAPATVHKAHQVLSKALRGAVEGGLLPANPAEHVQLPRLEREEVRFLTPSEVSTLADTIDERYRSFVLVGAYAGLRFGEMAGLRRSRLDLMRRRVEVAEIVVEVQGHHVWGPPKTRAGRRSVPLPRFVAQELEQHCAGFGADELVFAAPHGGPLRASLFRRRIWAPAIKRADLDGLTPHGLRHTAVALWIAAGATPLEVARRAGHTSVVTVLDRYGHLLPKSEDEVTDRLDAMGGAVGPGTAARNLAELPRNAGQRLRIASGGTTS